MLLIFCLILTFSDNQGFTKEFDHSVIEFLLQHFPVFVSHFV